VLAVGPGALDKDGKRITPSVQAGDKVLIPQVRGFDVSGETGKIGEKGTRDGEEEGSKRMRKRRIKSSRRGSGCWDEKKMIHVWTRTQNGTANTHPHSTAAPPSRSATRSTPSSATTSSWPRSTSKQITHHHPFMFTLDPKSVSYVYNTNTNNAALTLYII
jgi:hypothetical protein